MVGPWGDVKATCEEKETIVYCDVDLKEVRCVLDFGLFLLRLEFNHGRFSNDLTFLRFNDSSSSPPLQRVS